MIALRYPFLTLVCQLGVLKGLCGCLLPLYGMSREQGEAKIRGPLVKDGARGAGVGGEPVEVFLGELFGGVAGGVYDTHWPIPVEDWNG